MGRQLLLVFLGGGLGSVLRLATYHASRVLLPSNFPFGTIMVNVLGGLMAGIVAAILVQRSAGGNDPAALFLITGLLGGFTTFSAFSLDAVLLWQRGSTMIAAVYVVGSVFLSIAAVVAGFAAVRALS